MGLSFDCSGCWQTPCTCGYSYRNMSKHERIELATVILGITREEINKLKIPNEHPEKTKELLEKK